MVEAEETETRKATCSPDQLVKEHAPNGNYHSRETCIGDTEERNRGRIRQASTGKGEKMLLQKPSSRQLPHKNCRTKGREGQRAKKRWKNALGIGKRASHTPFLNGLSFA